AVSVVAMPSPAAIEDLRASIAWRFSPRYSLSVDILLLVGNGAGGSAPDGGIDLRLLRPEDSFRYELSMTRLGGRHHVVVEPEHVGRVVGLLDGRQALIALRAVNRCGVGRLIRREVVHVTPVALPGLHAVEQLGDRPLELLLLRQRTGRDAKQAV